MAVEYRRVAEAEIPETVEIFLASVADLYARTGILAPPPSRHHVEINSRHIYKTGIFHVAEVDGRLSAIAHAVVRGHLWFLSGFWALPGLQHRGIGGPLLKRVMDEGAQAGARTFFTWSSSDTGAMASYMKAGMLPGYQILTFAGTPRASAVEDASVEVRPLTISAAARIDEQVRETGREVDHRFWLEEAGYQGMLIARGHVPIAYFYVNKGIIGPAAWTLETDAETLLEAACREAARDGAREVRLMTPGLNHAAIRFALSKGLRLMVFSHLLTSAPFGRMEQYLSSGPSLF